MKTSNLDFVLNGVGRGDVATQMINCGFNTNTMRPWIGNDGRSYITLVENGTPKAYPVTNATATLRKDDWIQLDRAIIRAAQPRLRLVADLRAANLEYNIPNGMGKTVLQTERMGDVSPAIVSMDAVRESQRDRPEFDLINLPLPIIHKDFSFTARQIEVSRNGGSPLDTTMAELSARKVAEIAEQMAIGSYPIYNYAGGFIYGLTNFPDRETVEITDPTTTGWTPNTLVTEILEMKQRSTQNYHWGPWNLYLSTGWDPYLDADYHLTGGNNPNQTLRERIAKIDNIRQIVTLDYLEGFQIVLVQMTADVIREVVGMDITTLQWPSKGGLELNFKVMAILVPHLRADINGRSGIIHGDVV